MDAEVVDLDDARDDEKEYDIHGMAKKTLTFVAALAIGWMIERTYDSIRERRENDHDADIIEIE